MKTPLRNLVLLWAVALCAPPALAEHDVFGLGNGQDGPLDVQSSVTINIHAQVTADVAAGATLVPVDLSSGFDAGDLVMVLWTTGYESEPPHGSGINLTDSSVGLWELARLESVDSQGLRLTQPLVRAYAGRVTQVIRVPEYTTVNIRGAGRIEAVPWNGSRGGVVAFLATGAVTNQGFITASASGFRGGSYVPDGSGQAQCEGPDQQSPQGQQRGEGILNMRYGTTGRRSVANAGGGGVCISSGGGGGGNGGTGGQGGRSWYAEAPGSPGGRAVGGWGGDRLEYRPFERLTLGGGGGAGHCHQQDVTAPSGGAGGGAIFIRALRLEGNGIIWASGASPLRTSNCGAGGGGAGGTVSLRFVETVQCSSLLAMGGRGGTVAVDTDDESGYRGPGGGGGGGRLHVQAASISCSLDARGDVGGRVVWMQPSVPPMVLTNHGATDGTSTGPELKSPGLRIPEPPVLREPAAGSTTGAARPAITGTTLARARVLLTLDEVTHTLQANDSGQFTFTPTEALSEGEHHLSAVAEFDLLRSPASEPRSFTVDTPSAPTLMLPRDGAVLGTVRPTFSGTADSGNRVSVIVGVRRVGQVTAGGDGGWSVTSTEDLAPGEHTVHATAMDAMGNTSAPSAPVRFTVDTLAPRTPSITAPARDAWLATTVPTITGNKDPGSRVTVFIDLNEVGTVEDLDSSTWSFDLTTELAETRHTVQVQATDAAGNTSSRSSPLAFHVDITPPEKPVVTAPAAQAVGTTRTPVITGTAEPGSIITVRVGALTAPEVRAGSDRSWSTTLTSELPDGRHTLQARARDEAGNESLLEDSVTFTVDTRPPAAPVLGAPGPRWLVNSAKPRLSGTAESGAIVTVWLDNTEVGTATVNDRNEWDFTPADALEHGPHRLTVRARDTAGNEGEAASHDFTVDLRAPLAPVIATPVEGAVVGPSFATLTGTAEPGATVHATLDGLEGGQARVNAAGQWSLTLVLALLSGGHTVVVSATDEAGNTGAASLPLTFSVDLAPPAAPRLMVPTAGAVLAMPAPDFSGTAEAGSTVTVLIDGEALGTVEVNEAGVWSFTPEVRLTDGVHQVRAQARDGVGLSGPVSAVRSFSVDTIPPDTVLSGGPEASTQAREATFQLASSEAGSTFECRMNGGDYAPCPSPLTLEEVPEGAHTLEVRARDAAGNVDPTPVRHAWTIILPRDVEGGGVGCAAGGGSALVPLAWLAWAAALAARRRRP